MQVSVIINKYGMKINAGVNGKNWFSKDDVRKDLIGILAIVNVSLINPGDVGEYLSYKNCKCRKRLPDKLVEEYNENIDEKELYRTELHSNKIIYNLALNDYAKILVLVNAVPVQYA